MLKQKSVMFTHITENTALRLCDIFISSCFAGGVFYPVTSYSPHCPSNVM